MKSLTEVEIDTDDQEFIFGCDGKIRISRRKVGEILKVASSNISRLLDSNFFPEEEMRKLKQYGFQGDQLIKLMSHFALSKRVSKSTRKHCLDLLTNFALIGLSISKGEDYEVSEEINRLFFAPKIKGYIYFAECNGMVKIGISKNPDERVAQLQIGCPSKITLITTFAGSYLIEQRIHSIFATYRTSGEWFRFEGCLKEWIISIQNVQNSLPEM